MICAILAAGYATRLYPLTENFPKPLLEVKGKSILDWLIDDIETSGKVDRYVVISNHKYISHFETWKKNSALNDRISVIDDGSMSNETRLGAVRDIQFAIEKESVDTDMMVIAGDNLLNFSLSSFIDYYIEKRASVIMRYRETDVNKLRKCGVMTVDSSDRINYMEEKPENPFSEWCAPPFYIYKKDDLKYVKLAIDEGLNADAPGSFMAWLSQNTDVYAMEMRGRRYDIGNLESYDNVRSGYGGINI